MVTRLQRPRLAEKVEEFSLSNVSWELYETLRNETEGQNIRITFDEGRLYLMSPSPIHDAYKTWTARLIEHGSFVCASPIRSLGSTTWRRKDLLKGLEADECYYVRSEQLIRGRTDIDLDKDPPPDFALEIDITHHPMDRLKIYAALGVGEILQFDGERFIFLLLDRQIASYVEIDRSESFPFLTPAILQTFMVRFEQIDENSVLREFQTSLTDAGYAR